YDYTFDTRTLGAKTNEIYTNSGGKNWALTYTNYLTDDLSMKLLYGDNKRQSFTRSQSDIDCNRVVAETKVTNAVPVPGGVPLGCPTNSTVQQRNDERKEARADFEWKLGDHLVRFGYDHEKDTSNYRQHYTGPGEVYYNIYYATPGSTINNTGGVLPAG